MFGFHKYPTASSNLLPFTGVRETQGVRFCLKFIKPAVCQALGEALGV